MGPVFDVRGSEREQALAAAVNAVREGQLVVLPTDTVYGVGADPFNAQGVAALLAAKGRGRDKPSAVLIPERGTVEGLAMSVPSYARRLMDAFWPGALTLVFRAQPSLHMDLGDTNGTVGLRVPDGDVVRELLRATGPLAVSSANRTGEPPVTSVMEAGFAFGPNVSVYLDAGTISGGMPSTIIDCTKADPVLLRQGGLSVERIREVLGPIDILDATGAPIAERQRDDDPALEQAQTAPTGFPAQSARGDLSQVGAGPTSNVQGEASSVETGAEMPTQYVPVSSGALSTGGVGAEPPFDRDAQSAAELPRRRRRENR